MRALPPPFFSEILSTLLGLFRPGWRHVRPFGRTCRPVLRRACVTAAALPARLSLNVVLFFESHGYLQCASNANVNLHLLWSKEQITVLPCAAPSASANPGGTQASSGRVRSQSNGGASYAKKPPHHRLKGNLQNISPLGFPADAPAQATGLPTAVPVRKPRPPRAPSRRQDGGQQSEGRPATLSK